MALHHAAYAKQRVGLLLLLGRQRLVERLGRGLQYLQGIEARLHHA